MDERSFLLNRETAVSYLNSLHHTFVFDGFANHDSDARIKVRRGERGEKGWEIGGPRGAAAATALFSEGKVHERV